MDQEKIGKLIASLRKQQNLTQTELGDKVGVGFKAVSKWERGITCPDISIINDLSKILGITADELLAGELKKETKEKLYGTRNHKPNKKLIIGLSIILLTIISIITIIFINNNRVYSYDLKSASDDYYVEGNVTFKGKEMTLIINKLTFLDKDFSKIKISNYEYELKLNDASFFAAGNGNYSEMIENYTSIDEFMREFSVYYKEKSNIKKQDIENGILSLNINFFITDNKILNKNIKFTVGRK